MLGRISKCRWCHQEPTVVKGNVLRSSFCHRGKEIIVHKGGRYTLVSCSNKKCPISALRPMFLRKWNYRINRKDI